jgi:hypothetical protein
MYLVNTKKAVLAVYHEYKIQCWTLILSEPKGPRRMVYVTKKNDFSSILSLSNEYDRGPQCSQGTVGASACNAHYGQHLCHPGGRQQ